MKKDSESINAYLLNTMYIYLKKECKNYSEKLNSRTFWLNLKNVLVFLPKRFIENLDKSILRCTLFCIAARSSWTSAHCVNIQIRYHRLYRTHHSKIPVVIYKPITKCVIEIPINYV